MWITLAVLKWPLTALKYFCINHGDQSVFSNWKASWHTACSNIAIFEIICDAYEKYVSKISVSKICSYWFCYCYFLQCSAVVVVAGSTLTTLKKSCTNHGDQRVPGVPGVGFQGVKHSSRPKITPYSAEILLYKPRRSKVFFSIGKHHDTELTVILPIFEIICDAYKGSIIMLTEKNILILALLLLLFALLLLLWGNQFTCCCSFCVTPYNAEFFFFWTFEIKGFFQFEIIINVLVSSFRFIWMPMLRVYGHYNYFTLSVRG